MATLAPNSVAAAFRAAGMTATPAGNLVVERQLRPDATMLAAGTHTVDKQELQGRAGDCGGCWGRASALSAASTVTCTLWGRSTWLLSLPRIAMSAPSGIRGASNAAVFSALRAMALETQSDDGHSSS